MKLHIGQDNPLINNRSLLSPDRLGTVFSQFGRVHSRVVILTVNI